MPSAWLIDHPKNIKPPSLPTSRKPSKNEYDNAGITWHSDNVRYFHPLTANALRTPYGSASRNCSIPAFPRIAHHERILTNKLNINKQEQNLLKIITLVIILKDNQIHAIQITETSISNARPESKTHHNNNSKIPALKITPTLHKQKTRTNPWNPSIIKPAIKTKPLFQMKTTRAINEHLHTELTLIIH